MNTQIEPQIIQIKNNPSFLDFDTNIDIIKNIIQYKQDHNILVVSFKYIGGALATCKFFNNNNLLNFGDWKVEISPDYSSEWKIKCQFIKYKGLDYKDDYIVNYEDKYILYSKGNGSIT